MIIANELDADIAGSTGTLCRRGSPWTSTSTPPSPWRQATATVYSLAGWRATRWPPPNRIWCHFLDGTWTVTVAEDHVRVDLALRTYTPVLIDADFPELDIEVPWWGGRSLRFDFPPGDLKGRKPQGNYLPQDQS